MYGWVGAGKNKVNSRHAVPTSGSPSSVTTHGERDRLTALSRLNAGQTEPAHSLSDRVCSWQVPERNVPRLLWALSGEWTLGRSGPRGVDTESVCARVCKRRVFAQERQVVERHERRGCRATWRCRRVKDSWHVGVAKECGVTPSNLTRIAHVLCTQRLLRTLFSCDVLLI